jgi:hypothetical protein
VALETLTTALQRHHSLTPPHDVRVDRSSYPSRSESDFITLPNEQHGDSSDPSNGHSAGSSTSSSPPSSGSSSPRPQWKVPGNFIDASEKVGLPGIRDSDGYARTEAARVVRSHTRKRFGALGRKSRVRHNRKTLVDEKTTRNGDGDRPTRKSADSTDIEHDAASSTNSLSMGGGVLSALLTLYNQQDSGSFSTPSIPERPLRELPPEKTWLQVPTETYRKLGTEHEELQRGRPSSVPTASFSPGSSSRGSSVDSQEGNHRGENNRARSKIPFSSSMFAGGKPRQARSDAGVLGPLIASTGNLMGVGSPASSELQPDVKRPGYHLLRFV